jgi:hypothetical protein
LKIKGLAKNFALLFPRKKWCINFDQKMNFAVFWAIFIANSTGHTVNPCSGAF